MLNKFKNRPNCTLKCWDINIKCYLCGVFEIWLILSDFLGRNNIIHKQDLSYYSHRSGEGFPFSTSSPPTMAEKDSFHPASQRYILITLAKSKSISAMQLKKKNFFWVTCYPQCQVLVTLNFNITLENSELSFSSGSCISLAVWHFFFLIENLSAF